MAPSAPAPRICCLDLDTFFVSVERLVDPSLVGQPVVIGALPGGRGVVTAASYEVRALGVRSGMPIGEAHRLAPDACFRPNRHGVYGGYAASVKEVLQRFTPEVRTASIDEFFLDFRGCERLWSDPSDVDDDATIERVVGEMREAIQAEVGLPASAGIGTTRAVAKIASGLAKPAAVRMVRSGDEAAFVAPLSVGRYPGIGPVAQASLAAAGIHTLGALLDLPRGPVRRRFATTADVVRRGIDGRRSVRHGGDRPAFREHDDPHQGTVGSISNERTFGADVGDRSRVVDQLRGLSERVCWRARRRGVRARTITLKLRTADFRTVTRARTGWPTHAEDEVFSGLLDLLPRAWVDDRAVRLLGVALSRFVGEDRQLPLPLAFDTGSRTRPHASGAIDAVRERFGYQAIRIGALPS